MDRRFPQLPPLTSLRGFEAAARLGSFSRAADELHLTQSAVSHQIRVLEDFFGHPLFHRVGRSIELTDAGTDFYGTVEDTLSNLDQGSRRLAIYAKESSVVLYASQSLAARWLTPRLNDLKLRHPDIEPWIASFHIVPELASAETHLLITTSVDTCDGWVSDDLFQEALVPLCHSSLADCLGKQPLTNFLANQNLLHDETPSSWMEWSKIAGLELEGTQSGTCFSEPGLALDAALHQQGIVLGSAILADLDIEAGTLIPLSKHLLPTQETYRLYCRDDSLRTPSVAIMRDWILQKAASTRDALMELKLYPA